MTDWNALIEQSNNQVVAKAVSGLDEDPESGARSLELASATGAPPELIHADQEGFEQDHRTALTAKIVRSNAIISEYIRTHSMANVVSNDDYGNLDNFTRSAPQRGWLGELSEAAKTSAGADWLRAIRGAAGGAVEGIRKTAADYLEEPEQPIDVTKSAPQLVYERRIHDVADAGNLAFQFLMAPIVGAAGGATEEAVTAGTGNAAVARNLAGQAEREAETALEALPGFAGHAAEVGHAAARVGEFQEAKAAAEGARNAQTFRDAGVAYTDALNRARPWVDAGQEPPRGIDPSIDQAKAWHNAEYIRQLGEHLDAAQQVLTTDRSADYFHWITEKVNGDHEISIDGDHIAELYGDKIPSADDGLLGLVPGIEDKLDRARRYGERVYVPTADLLTHMEPELYKELSPHMRAWEGGIGVEESKVPWEPKPMVDAPIAQARGAAGLEPMFAIGDRKLELKQQPSIPGLEYAHEYQFHDQDGKPVGELTIIPDEAKKELYVSNINGLAGLYSNSFGPSLVRDLTKQLKEFYPQFLDEKGRLSVTGHRVSGAREIAGTWETELAHPVVKLAEGWDTVDTRADYMDFREILEQKAREHFGYGITAAPEPTELLSAKHAELADAVTSTVERITGIKPDIVSDIQTERGGRPLGVYLPGHGASPARILTDLFSSDPVGYGRHETVHWLKDHGFWSPQEWAALSKAAREENWIGKHGIDERYPDLNEFKRIEESIAEEARRWGQEWDAKKQPTGLVEQALDKIRQLWEGIQTRFKELTGQYLSPDEIFRKMERGDVRGQEGRAKGGGPAFSRGNEIESNRLRDELSQSIKDIIYEAGQKLRVGDKEFSNSVILAHQIQKGLVNIADLPEFLRDQAQTAKDAYDKVYDRPAFALGDDEMRARMDNLRANAVGLDAKTFKSIQKLLQERHEADIAASLKRAQADQARTQTKEWKANAKEVAKQAEADVRQRPDVLADMFIGAGEIKGEQLPQKRYQLRSSDLTDEQKAALPRHYYINDGLPVDGVAKLLGFPSGNAMLEGLTKYTSGRDGMSARERMAEAIKQETDSRMAAKFGDLQKNIMDDAQDQALSENDVNLVIEEWQAAAMQAGTGVVDKDLMRAEALRDFNARSAKEVSHTAMLGEVAKRGKEAHDFLANGDSVSALQSLERRARVMVQAAEAKKFAKEQTALAKTMKQSNRQFNQGAKATIDPSHNYFIQQIMAQVGERTRRSMDDVVRETQAAGFKDLEEFDKYAQDSGKEMPVWPQLYDRGWKTGLDTLSVEDYRNVANTVKTIAHNGKMELKVLRQGEAEDWADVKGGLVQNIVDSAGGEIREPKGRSMLRSYYVGNLQMENILNRWDGFDHRGLWNQYIMRDLIDGANQIDAWKKEYAAKLKAVKTPEGIKDELENTLFRDQDTGTLIPFTRKNLLVVMLNTGTKDNLAKLAGGYGLKPAQVMDWVNQHATKEEWDFARGIWGIFKEIKGRSDTMYRSLSGGIAAKNIPGQEIETKFGKVRGDYYPIIHHSEMEGKSSAARGRDNLFEPQYTRASTPAGYTKERVMDASPLALDLDALPGRLSEMLHDIGLRPAVLNAAKAFYDKDIKSAVRAHYGTEYRDLLDPYLQGVANSAVRNNRAMAGMNSWAEFTRQNVIATLIGFNPGTVLKHGPSALVSSVREVGLRQFAKAFAETAPAEFLHWTRSLVGMGDQTAETNWQFAVRNSLELQRRDRNWEETLYGSSAGLIAPGDKFTPWRQRIMQWSAKPVALSDMLSAVPTWLAKYNEEIGKHGVHGDAVAEADYAVRRAHGSTAVTSRTAIQQGWSPWLTSVYNYFSDIMNRQMETIWKAGQTKDLVKAGDYKTAMATVPGLSASVFAYAIWPALVEHMVAPEQSNPDDPWAWTAGKQLAFTASASWPLVRDVVSAAVYGRDPQFGLTGTALRMGTSELRELWKVYNDIKSSGQLEDEHAAKLIEASAQFIGLITGLPGAQAGRSAKFIWNVNTGKEEPRDPWEWTQGLWHGKGATR